jgi:MFS family permease
LTATAEAPEGAVARLAHRLPFFYGWVIVYISFIGVFMMGAVSYWGMPVFLDPMAEDTGWSRAWILGGLSARFIVGATGGLFVGHLADKKGAPSKLLLVGVIIDAASLFALQWVESPLQFVLVYGVIGGAGNTGMRVVQSTLVAKWFVARRGTAVGFSSNGGGVSALIMVPIIAFLITEMGWRDAWAALGVIMLVLMLPLVPLAVRAPEDLGLEPDNGLAPVSGPSRVSAASERSYHLSEVVRTWQFWILMIGVLIGNYSLQTHTVVLVPYLKEIGFSAAAAASALSVYGVFSLGTRFGWGILSDKLGVRTAIMLQATLTALAALLLLQVGGTLSMYVLIAFTGMTLSGFPPLQILVWPQFFGRVHIGSIIGLTQFFSTIAGAIGPLIAGFAFDRTGSHSSTLWLLVVTWLACVAVMYTVKPSPARRTSAEMAT